MTAEQMLQASDVLDWMEEELHADSSAESVKDQIMVNIVRAQLLARLADTVNAALLIKRVSAPSAH